MPMKNRSKQGWPPPKKSLGQVLLVDSDVAREILVQAGFKKGGQVLEIGPGRGILTKFLIDWGIDTICCEIDSRMSGLLSNRFGKCDNFRLITEDILHLDVNQAIPAGDFHVLGNLPYHLTSEILFKFFKYVRDFWDAGEKPRIKSMSIMIQKEVADRLLSKPHSKLWGILPLQTALFGEVEHVVDVPADCFNPKPKVNSTVVKIIFHPGWPVKIDDYSRFTEIVRTAYGSRRKMLRNTLKLYDFPEGSGIDLQRRPEELGLQEFAELANAASRKVIPDNQEPRHRD